MSNKPSSTTFPLWFTAMTWAFFAFSTFIMGIWTFFDAGDLVFPDAGDTAEYPIRWFSIRHIAFAWPLAFGLLKKNAIVLRTMYMIFLVIAILDVIGLFAFGYDLFLLGDQSTPVTGTVAAFLFLIPVAAGLTHLRKYD